MFYLNIFSTICFIPWWLLAMLLPLLIGLLIGYLIWAKYKTMLKEAEKERDIAEAKYKEEHAANTRLRSDVNGLKYQIGELERENLSFKNTLAAAQAKFGESAENTVATSEKTSNATGSVLAANTSGDEDSAAFNARYNAAFQSTDLRLIEGIDPGIEMVMRNAGINNWADLAAKKPEELDAIFKAAGPEYEGINSAVLIQQASLADAGKWTALIALQKAMGEGDIAKAQLYYGVKASKNTSFENYALLLKPDNLQVIEGIGPKTETTLKAAGINTWFDIANATPEKLKSILVTESKGFRMSRTNSWPRQAQLAVDGKWADLVAYQKFLDSGRDDMGDFDTPSKASMMVEKLSNSSLSQFPRDNSFNYATIFTNDNLQIIEGIGPKIEAAFKEAGINNWVAIGSRTPQELRAVLDKAGSKFRINNPESWPRQARLAAEGKWEELIAYQKFLDGGRDKAGDFSNDSKLEKMGMRLLGFSNDPEDLKIIEGIGPKIETLLKEDGITSWSELAAANVDRLKEILSAAGDKFRFAQPATWPKQAGLAAKGQWSELKDYQDYLDGGKEPTA